MTKNREISEVIFKAMQDNGFAPYDIEYGNRYFVFNKGEDSVIHFRVKRLWNHWKFGMWVNSEYLDEKYREEEKHMTYDEMYRVAYVFAQYESNIDKFKPSRSSLCVEFKAYEWESDIQNGYLWWRELIEMLKMMKKHPLMCYMGVCGKEAGFYPDSFIYRFIKCEIYNMRKDFELWFNKFFWGNWTKVKCHFARKDKCIHSLEIYDFKKENPGWSASYDYQVRIVFTKDSTSDEELAWLNRWFRKDEYGKQRLCGCTAVTLDFIRKVGEDGEYCYVLEDGD